MSLFSASALAGGSSLLGTVLTNRTNRSISSARNAQQERLSSTEYQRGVADLRAAGLNPMLATKFGGNSTPPLHTPTIQNPVTPAVTNALTASLQKAQIDNLKTQSAKNLADADAANASIPLTGAKVQHTQANTEVSAATVQKIKTDIAFVRAKTANVKAELPNFKARFNQIIANTKLTKQQKDNKVQELLRNKVSLVQAMSLMPHILKTAKSQSNSAAARVPTAENIANQADTWWSRNVTPYLQQALGIGRLAPPVRVLNIKK